MLPYLRAFGYGVGLRLNFSAKELEKTPDPYEMDREMTGQCSHPHQRLSGSLVKDLMLATMTGEKLFMVAAALNGPSI